MDGSLRARYGVGSGEGLLERKEPRKAELSLQCHPVTGQGTASAWWGTGRSTGAFYLSCLASIGPGFPAGMEDGFMWKVNNGALC